MQVMGQLVIAASSNNQAARCKPVSPQQQHSSAKHVLSTTRMHQLHWKTALCSRQHESGCITACGRLTAVEHVPPARIRVGPLAGAVDKVAGLPVNGAPTILLQQPSRPGAIANALMGAGAALQTGAAVLELHTLNFVATRQGAVEAHMGAALVTGPRLVEHSCVLL